MMALLIRSISLLLCFFLVTCYSFTFRPGQMYSGRRLKDIPTFLTVSENQPFPSYPSPVKTSLVCTTLRAGYGSDELSARDQRGLFSKYNELLEKYPTSTKVVSAAILGGVSDILVQTASFYMKHNLNEVFHFDFRRLLVFTAVCGLYFGPVVNAWFSFLTKIPFPAQLSDTSKVMAMVAIDQTVGAVIVTSGFFYAFELIQRLIQPRNGPYLEGVLEAATKSLRRNLFSTIQASWYCWPMVNFINFRFVPAQYRLLFSNVAAIFWNMYLTCMANSS